MNEKVVVLFILGMGAVRLYEDYVDEVDRDDDDEEDRFKKRKISRRDVSDDPLPPANTFETVVEVQQNRFSEKLMKACDNIGPHNCSCRYTDAVSLSCAHNFCEKCILDHLDKNPKCPICDKPANKNNVQPDAKLRQLINGLSSCPSTCHDCKEQTEQLKKCADCNNYICETCHGIHFNKLKLEIENWFKEKAPQRMSELDGYRKRLSEIEIHIDEFTKITESNLSQHQAKLMQILDNMQGHREDVELALLQQLSEANNLLRRTEDLISESSNETILESNVVSDLLLEVDKFESRFNKFRSDMSDRPLEIPLTEHNIQCLRELNILETIPLNDQSISSKTKKAPQGH
ncbi:unnamed protein product [Rodentolepis nana]|uniref:RING-type domain-containing protein n=1 Tax=Rodentolepis nana TaxID=102285 RepID=A0A0R3TJH1_RODNA|nr:unnamed protein product [Rodentolepis nana]